MNVECYVNQGHFNFISQPCVLYVSHSTNIYGVSYLLQALCLAQRQKDEQVKVNILKEPSVQ